MWGKRIITGLTAFILSCTGNSGLKDENVKPIPDNRPTPLIAEVEPVIEEPKQEKPTQESAEPRQAEPVQAPPEPINLGRFDPPRRPPADPFFENRAYAFSGDREEIIKRISAVPGFIIEEELRGEGYLAKGYFGRHPVGLDLESGIFVYADQESISIAVYAMQYTVRALLGRDRHQILPNREADSPGEHYQLLETIVERIAEAAGAGEEREGSKIQDYHDRLSVARKKFSRESFEMFQEELNREGLVITGQSYALRHKGEDIVELSVEGEIQGRPNSRWAMQVTRNTFDIAFLSQSNEDLERYSSVVRDAYSMNFETR